MWSVAGVERVAPFFCLIGSVTEGDGWLFFLGVGSFFILWVRAEIDAEVLFFFAQLPRQGPFPGVPRVEDFANPFPLLRLVLEVFFLLFL